MSKVIIAAGGTGGHTYPAAALGHDLQELNVEILFLGQNLPSPFQEISSGVLSGKKPIQSMKGLFRILRGIIQSFQAMRKFQPDLVVGFGSVYTFPILIAALIKRVPLVLHEQNCIPGRVNRLMASFAKFTAITFPNSSSYLSGKTEQVAMPLRKGYQPGSISPSEARKYYGLNPDQSTLLVFGGSQGATAINHLMSQSITLLKNKGIQVLHFVGQNDSSDEFQERYRREGVHACVKTFEDRMDLAWQASDLMISRAGAGTIAEQMAFEVPGILIPYPYAMDNHQEKNADFMQNVIKGGVKSMQTDLNSELLAEQISQLLDPNSLRKMQESIRDYKEQNPQNEMADLVWENL